jgi:hypothetical protein
MSTHAFRASSALTGILGVILLLTSFAINPGPASNATISQAAEFADHHRNAILLGGWLQAVGSLLSICFALALVRMAGAMTRLAGWLELLGGTVLVLVSLIEVFCYILTVQEATSGNTAALAIALDLTKAVQHGFSMVAAPAVFLPLAVVILGSRVLPAIFGYLALALGVIFAVLGLVGLFSPLQNVVNILAGLQGVWFLAAAITLLVMRVDTRGSDGAALTTA